MSPKALDQGFLARGPRATDGLPPSGSKRRGAYWVGLASLTWANVGRLMTFARTTRGQVWIAWAIVLAMVLLDSLLVGQHALLRYQSYHADAFDLGNMDQAVWNTLHGHPFRFTNRGLDTVGPPTRLAIHVEPILLLIAPFYLVHSGPETLLVLQTVALAAGAIPLFALGLRHLPALPFVASAIAVAYLITPEVLGEALWDFHPVALATPLLLVALWALDARRWSIWVIAAVLATLTKEDVALSLLPLCVYIAFWLRQRRLGLIAGVALVAWLALCFGVILPHFNVGTAGGNNYWYRYAWLGKTPHDAIINLLLHPWLPLTYTLGDSARSGYVALLLRTGGGLGIFMPALWICALPELAVNVLSIHWEQYSGFYQYNAMLVAYLMASAVYGVAVLYAARLRIESVGDSGASEGLADQSRSPALEVTRLHTLAGATLVACATVFNHVIRKVSAVAGRHLNEIPLPVNSSYDAAASVARVKHPASYLPIRSSWIPWLVIVWLVVTGAWNIATVGPRLSAFWFAGSAPTAHQAEIDALLARVPASASVAATDTLDPHLSDRYALYLMPDPQSYQAEYVAVNLLDVPSFSKEPDQRMYDTMLASGRYRVVGKAGDVVLLQRIAPPLVTTNG